MNTNPATTDLDFNDLYGSKFLAADADIQDEKPQTLTITAIDVRDFGINKKTGKNDVKMVLSFAEVKKGMCLNKTNAGMIAKLYGPKSADWVGKRVTVYATDVQYGDEMTRGLRIKSKVPA